MWNEENVALYDFNPHIYVSQKKKSHTYAIMQMTQTATGRRSPVAGGAERDMH
jgi:hypothetical protein